jgi:hypothetical protein
MKQEKKLDSRKVNLSSKSHFLSRAPAEIEI